MLTSQSSTHEELNAVKRAVFSRMKRMFIRAGHLFGMGKRKCSHSTIILITIIGVSFTLYMEDAARPAVPAVSVEVARLVRSARHRPAAAQQDADAVFRRLRELLETVPAEPSCRHQHQLGGRCFICQTNNNGMVLGQLDGPKPICLDWLPRNNCSVLSFGINNDFSFDDAMADLGCTVHAFDPTMGVADFRRSEHVFFHNVGIAASDGHVHGFPVVSLATAARLAHLQAGVIDYLKLDVEGSEWEVLLTGDGGGQLRRVAQLAVEFHLSHGRPSLADGTGLEQTEVNPTVPVEHARQFVEAISSLQSAGFVLRNTDHSIACHNYAGGCLPFLYETVWVNTRLISR